MSACIFTFSHIFAKQVPNHLTHYNSRKASGVCKLGRWHLLGLMPQVVVLGSVDSGWINIPTTQTSWKHGHSAAKSIHFLILHVDWLLTAVFCFGASYAGGRRRTDARTPFFFTQVVWLEPACSQHCEPARILWWSCWCLILDIPNGQIKKITNRVRSEFPPLKKVTKQQAFFSHPPERGWVFSAINYLDFFLHEWRLRNMQSHRSKWSIGSDCGMDMDMATRCSKHVAVATVVRRKGLSSMHQFFKCYFHLV